MSAKSEGLGFKVQVRPPGQALGDYQFKRFFVKESLESITLEHIWSEIRGCFPSHSNSFSSQSHGIFMFLSKDESAPLEPVNSDQQFRSLIARLGATDKIRIECKEKEDVECKEKEDDSFVMIDSSCTSPKELSKSECSATPSTASKSIASGLARGGQLFPEPRGAEASDSAKKVDGEINLTELAETFEHHSNSVDDCKGKTAVVLFGQTGSGKTSTTLFFLGAHLVTKESSSPVVLFDGSLDHDGEENLALDDSDSSRFPGFNINHSNKSETKVITAKFADTTGFQIDAESSQLQDLFVADLPGFDDSEGPQSDILQCVTSLNAIKSMRGIWPVFLIPCDCIEGRGNVQLKMKPLVRLIGRIFSPIEDYIPTEEEMRSGKEGHLHFLFTRADGKHDAKWVLRELSKLCDPTRTDDLGGADVLRLVKYMFFYVKAFLDKKQSGLLVIRKEHLVSSDASNHPCVTLKRITSSNPIRDTPSLKCPLSEMTLSRLHTKVSEQASVIKNLFMQDPLCYGPACNTLQLLSVISKAVCDETVKDVFENALQFVGQQIRMLLESANGPMHSLDFERLHAVMLTMKNCIDALKPHPVLREFCQEVDAKKKELCRGVTQIANEARAAFFPADGEWSPSSEQDEKDRLQTLQAIERCFFARGTHQFILQNADQRYPHVKKHLQAIVCKCERIVTENLEILFNFAQAEIKHHSACGNTTSGQPNSLELPKLFEAADTAEALFKSLTISKRIMDNYDGHLTSSFLKLRDDTRRFLSETFQDSLLMSYCHSIRSLHLHVFTSRLITCLDFLKELSMLTVLQMIDSPGIYDSEVVRIQRMCNGIFGDIDSNFQSKQYSFVHRDMQFLRSFQSCVHTEQFLPHEIHQKRQLIDRSMAKLCNDVQQYVEHFRDREKLELRDCQKMVDLLKELHTAQCLQPSDDSTAASESKWSVSATLDASLDILTSECKTRCLNFRLGFMRHDDLAVVCSQLNRLSRMNPLQDLNAIKNSANATPSIVAEFHEQMKEITEAVIFETADSHFALNWQSLETETQQLENRLISIQWLAAFFDRPQDQEKFAEMSGFGRHDCFINFVQLCQHRHEFLKRKLDEFKEFFKGKIEEHRAIALEHIQTKNPARDMPILKQSLDFMKELMSVACIDKFMESMPSKRYNDVIEKLKDKIGTLEMDTTAAFDRTNYECVTPNREYFERVSLHISHHMPESVDIGKIITKFSKQHSESTIQMRQNLPQYLQQQQFREIAVCLTNLQRTKDSEPNDKTLFEGFNDEISAYLAELHHSAEDLDDDPAKAITTLRDVLEKSQRTLSLHTVELSGRQVVDVFKDILKCCWDKFEGLEKSTLGLIKKYKFVQASKSFALLKKCKTFDPVLRSLTSELKTLMGETQIKHFSSKIEEFKQQHIEPLYNRIVKEFQSEGVDQGSSGCAKVAAMFEGVSAADSEDSNHSVLFDGIIPFDDLSKELSNMVIVGCSERLQKVATCTGQSKFPEAEVQLECATLFLAAINRQTSAKTPNFLRTADEHTRQKSALERARQNNVLNRFQFTSSEVPRCIELLNDQLVSDYNTFEASWKALEKTLKHEVTGLTQLTSKPYSSLEEKDIHRVFEVSSGIIRFGSEGRSLLDNHCTSHQFRNMVGEASHNLSSFVKKLLQGYESQRRNFERLADLSNMVQKLSVNLQDPGLQDWSDARTFVEKCSKISQTCDKAIQSVQEAISTVKEFDIKKHDQASAKKLTETLTHLRKQENQEGHEGDFEVSDSNEDSETGKYQAVVAQISAQIQSTSKLLVKIESDHKVHRESFEQLYAAMTNCRVFEADSALREIAERERTAAQKRLLQVISSLASTFSSFVKEQNFQELDVLVSTGKELDSIFFDSFGTCFPHNKALLHHFGEAFKSLLDDKQKSFPRRRNVKDYAHGMIDIRQISTAVSDVSLPEVRKIGDSMLKDLIDRLPQSIDLYALGCELSAMDAAGREIVETFPQFKAVKNAQFNKQTEGVSIQHALDELKQPRPDDSSTGRVPTPASECERMNSLLKRYQETEETLLKNHLQGYAEFTSQSSEGSLVRQLHDQAQALHRNWQPIQIIDLLAGIGAVWTITASGKEFLDSGRKKETLLRLHNVQVIGLIRLLKLSEEQQHVLVETAVQIGRVLTAGLVQLGRKPMSEGHMIQVGTGEGKSVLLGVLSCFLAMTGIQVRCACYSKLLSRRDYGDFEPLFKRFNVDSHIRYSTIDELAEECINDKGDVRALALRHVGRSSGSATRRPQEHASAPKRILLIDEVDVFFTETFMGESYNPVANLGCENTTTLMRYVWQHRQQAPHTLLSSVKQLPQYKALKQNTFSAAAAGIVDREVFNMIADVKAFNDPPYEVYNKADQGAEADMRIGYKRLDGMSDFVYGYKTAFAWLCEAEKATVSSQTAETFLQFQIPCGRFSYASIPKHHFDCVLGVTGTLSCLTANERQLILNDYKIGPQHMTYLPSLYGPSNMKFNGKDNFVVEPSEQRWAQTILKRINDEAVTRGRPILIFFESEGHINQFLSSDYGRRLPPQHQLIVESTLDVPFRVSKATCPSQITLLSRVFGRGLDFKVNHPSIEAVDGVCVICTFFPDSASEEIQIKGRAARQGKKGTFEFIVCQSDVQRDFSATAEQLKDSAYEFLVNQRTSQTDQKLDSKKEKVARCAPDHQKSMDLVRNLQSIHPQADAIFQGIQGFLRGQGSAGPIHTIFCLDDSGSMSSSWSSVKEAVRAFIEIRQELGSPGDLFSCIQFSDSTHVSFKQTQIATALQHASSLKFRGGGTLFIPALQAVSGLVQAGQQVAIVFMTDGDSSDNPVAIAQSIMGIGAQISFFGVAFTPDGKTQTLQDTVKAFNGALVEAANVKELRAQFQVIAQNPTAAHAR